MTEMRCVSRVVGAEVLNNIWKKFVLHMLKVSVLYTGHHLHYHRVREITSKLCLWALQLKMWWIRTVTLGGGLAAAWHKRQ
jgi:hypothetical protein